MDTEGIFFLVVSLNISVKLCRKNYVLANCINSEEIIRQLKEIFLLRTERVMAVFSVKYLIYKSGGKNKK